jgi:hypothetical protein
MSLIVLSRLLAALVAAALAFAYVLNDVTPESLPWIDHEDSITLEESANPKPDWKIEDKTTGTETKVLDR